MRRLLLAFALGSVVSCGRATPSPTSPRAGEGAKAAVGPRAPAAPRSTSGASHTLPLPEKTVDVAYCGSAIAISTQDAEIQLLDEQTGALRRTIQAAPAGSHVAELSCDTHGERVAARVSSSTQATLRVWSTATGEGRSLAPTNSQWAHPAWSRDDRRIFLVHNGRLLAVDVATGTPQTAPLPESVVLPLAMGADGSVVLSHGARETFRVFDGDLRVLRDARFDRLPAQGDDPGSQLVLYAFDRDNVLVAAGVQTFDLAHVGPRGTRILQRGRPRYQPIASLPGERALVYDGDGLVVLDARTGEETFRAKTPHGLRNSDAKPVNVRGDGDAIVFREEPDGGPEALRVLALPQSSRRAVVGPTRDRPPDRPSK